MTEFISRNYGKEGYEIIIKTDSHDHYRATEEFARRLIDHAKPMRNADKIRQMSDEELAKYLYQMQKNILRYVATVIGYSEEFDFADEAPDLLEWLKQPAEVIE